jgi:hypothetical protein
MLSNEYVHLSSKAGMMRPVRTLDFILIGEGSDTGRHISLPRSIELDRCTASEYKDATLTVLVELIRRNIRIQSVVGDGFSSRLHAVRRT